MRAESANDGQSLKAKRVADSSAGKSGVRLSSAGRGMEPSVDLQFQIGEEKLGMRIGKVLIGILSILSVRALPAARPSSGTVVGRVTLRGTPPKLQTIDMSKQPDCLKLNTKKQMTEQVLTGPGNSLENVVVYVSEGESDTATVPSTPVTFDQRNCHYTTHVLAFRVGQEVNISNSDPFSHNIHPLPTVNREWNKMQPPGTPPFSYSYANPEFIPVKCNIHSWMRAYFVVLRTAHFAVTGEDGQFTLPDLPPGKYTLTAWHETYGTESQQITVGEGGSLTIDFAFKGTL
jgi:plastocyanin